MVNRQVIEWDKDDIDALRFMKVDVLGLGMLGCLRRAFNLLRQHKKIDLDLATIPTEDPAHLRDDPRSRHTGDISDQIAAPNVDAAATETKNVLRHRHPGRHRPGPVRSRATWCIRICAVARAWNRSSIRHRNCAACWKKPSACRCSRNRRCRSPSFAPASRPEEADQLRRSMATFKFTGGVTPFSCDKMINGMVERGYTKDFAEQTFSRIEGFGSYGFPESHAASFAFIAYASAWLKCHHPDVFCRGVAERAAEGFYAPAQIVRDAENSRRGRFRPVLYQRRSSRAEDSYERKRRAAWVPHDQRASTADRADADRSPRRATP